MQMALFLSVAIMQVTACYHYAVRSLCSTYGSDNLHSNLWVTIFIVIIQLGVLLQIMQVVFYAVHYAQDCFVIILVTISATAM